MVSGRSGAEVDLDARLAAARAALARAETTAGLRTRLRTAGPPADDVRPSPASLPTPPTPRSGEPALPAPLALPAPPPGPLGEDLPVPAALAPLFPGGVLARGSVVQVTGSTSLLLVLAASVASVGAWAALAAMPDVGWRAAAEAGLDLERVIVVPRPGADAPAALGALVDGVDLLIIGRCPGLAERDRRSLAARLRARQAVLLSTEPWPGASLVLHVERVAWDGLGQGWGVLAHQRMTVTAVGRGAAGGPLRAVTVRLGPGGVEAEPDGAARPALRAVG